jgi:protein-tyrosine phosphatase
MIIILPRSLTISYSILKFIMGTVHGVYLKYVGLSALSYAGYSMLSSAHHDNIITTTTNTTIITTAPPQTWASTISMMMLGYSTIINGMIAVLFKTERGMSIIGKNQTTGAIPLWSYVMFFPFHIPTLLYTHVHTRLGIYKSKTSNNNNNNNNNHNKKYCHVPVASEVQPGWWVGGCYGHELGKEWGGIIDLTVEFSESCRNHTKRYLSAPTWDGVPLSPEDLEAAASFAVEARKDGDVLVHCAHGRGRSTTVMCACLVKAGLFDDWKEAFEKGIKPNRLVCKLNQRMRENLAAWQDEYVDGKKAA